MAKTAAQIETSLANWATHYGAVLTKLDSDSGVTGTDYATAVALADPKEPYECARKFNALCAKLDTDVLVDEADYRAKCAVDFQRSQAITQYDQVEALHRALGALCAKLNEDLGVADTNYLPGVNP